MFFFSLSFLPQVETEQMQLFDYELVYLLEWFKVFKEFLDLN